MNLPDFDKVISDYLHREISGREIKLADFPYYSSNNHWETVQSSGRDDWVSGFWPGILWLAAAQNSRWKHLAKKATEQVIPTYQNNFNIGFRNNYSWAAGFEGTNNIQMKKMGLEAAGRLIKCFHEPPGLIGHRPGNNTLVTAADVLMNLPLLYWAIAHQPGNPDYLNCVKTTLGKLARLLLREDDSLEHLIKFDIESGKIIEKSSPQGKDGGCWSRGLAWATTGFILGGILLSDDKCFEIADKLLGYHDKNCAGIIPPFDYSIDLEKNPELTDTSAAAILASGLLLLGEHTEEERMQKKGQEIVTELFTHYRGKAEEPGLIGGGCYHQPSREGVNSATIWGDYYALESLYLVQKKTLPPQLNWLNKAA